MEFSHFPTLHYSQSHQSLPTPRRLPRLPKTASHVYDDDPPAYVEVAHGHHESESSSHPASQQSTLSPDVRTSDLLDSTHLAPLSGRPTHSGDCRNGSLPPLGTVSSVCENRVTFAAGLPHPSALHSSPQRLSSLPQICSQGNLRLPKRSSPNPAPSGQTLGFNSQNHLQREQQITSRPPHPLASSSRAESAVIVELELQPVNRQALKSTLARGIASLLAPSRRRLKKPRRTSKTITTTGETTSAPSSSADAQSWVWIETEES